MHTHTHSQTSFFSIISVGYGLPAPSGYITATASMVEQVIGVAFMTVIFNMCLARLTPSFKPTLANIPKAIRSRVRAKTTLKKDNELKTFT